MIFIDRDVERENFSLNLYHRWPQPMFWWQYALAFSLACSVGALGLLVFGR